MDILYTCIFRIIFFSCIMLLKLIDNSHFPFNAHASKSLIIALTHAKNIPYTPEREYKTRLLIARVTGRVRIVRVLMDPDPAKIIEWGRD